MKTHSKDSHPPAIEELFAGMHANGKYDYLRVILSRSGNCSLHKDYLMVTRNSFGRVRLLDVDFQEHRIQMDFQDISTEITKKIYLDVEDETFKFILVSWDDIQKIFLEESNDKTDKEMLEFDF